MIYTATKSATSQIRKPLWASLKPRRSAKAKGLTTQCDKKVKIKRKKWRPEPTLKNGIDQNKSGDYAKQNEKINDNFRSNNDKCSILYIL